MNIGGNNKQMISNFTKDLKQETIITNYVYDILFENYFDKKFKSESLLITDIKSQMKGIDILMKDLKNNKSIKFDLKSQSTYINNPLPTFALEVLYNNKNNQDKLGWFINDELETQFYGFIWIHKAELTNGNIISKDDFKKIEIMFVKKDKIIQELKNMGLNKEKIIDVSNEMRLEGKDTKIINNVKFRLTKNLQEKPVNIVLRKSFYKKICVQHFMIENHKANLIK